MLEFSVFLIAITVVAGELTPGIRVKFGTAGPDSELGKDFYIEIPQTLATAKAAKWVRTARPIAKDEDERPLPQLVLYCPRDKVVCALFDDTDYIAGLQISLPREEIKNDRFGWESRGFRKWWSAVKYVGKKFWSTQQYFVTEEYLKLSKEEKLAKRDNSRILHEGGVWVSGMAKKLLKVPADEEDIMTEGLFTQQACIPGMGLHYFYNMTTTMDCEYYNMYPWYPIVNNGKLVGTGLLVYGELPLNEGEKDWFERPTKELIQSIAPRGPECFYDLIEDPGLISIHVYYVNEPWDIGCKSNY